MKKFSILILIGIFLLLTSCMHKSAAERLYKIEKERIEKLNKEGGRVIPQENFDGPNKNIPTELPSEN